MAIWKNGCNELGQLPFMGESRSGLIETQYEEHNVITGMPDTSMPMVTNRIRYFLVIFI